ncbi:MAG TPA: hypothetical protein VGG25_11415 [Streptosporangiaceae bacterium]
MTAVASAVAGKTAEAAADGGRNALAALTRLVRSRAARDQPASAALSKAATAPRDPASIRELARALDRIAAADAGFRAQLQDLWPQVSAELTASHGGTANSNTGTVGGHLIQAADLHVEGGLHLGGIHGPPPT